MSKTLKANKPRFHSDLFLAGTPFKQKVVGLKTRYQRKPKHRNQEYA